MVKKPELGLEERKKILEYSLWMETFSSVFISGLLGIKHYTNSRTLGNKGSALSFNQKIDLLIDLGALDKNQKKKFQIFMEIRNQFMHNMRAVSFVDCYSFFENNNKNFVLKTYPQPFELSLEDQLSNATLSLSEDVLRMTMDLINKLEEKFHKDEEAKFNKASHTGIIQALKVFDTFTAEFISEKNENGVTIDAKILKEFQRRLTKKFSESWASGIASFLTAKKAEENKT